MGIGFEWTECLYEPHPHYRSDGLDTVGSEGGTTGNAVLFAIALGAGVDAAGYNFGERGSSLSGVVYLDSDADGVRDPGERGLPGVVVVLRDATGTVVASIATNPDGSYRFHNLPVGNYSVIETQPLGLTSSSPNTLNVTVPLGGVIEQNFGEIASSLAGRSIATITTMASRTAANHPSRT